MQKQEKKFFEGHRSTFWIKMPFGIEHPPPTHQLQSTCVQEGSRVPNLQMEFNYLDSFKSYGIFSDFVVPMWSLSSLHHPHIIPIVPTSSSHCPHHPHRPHIIPIAPRRSPCGLHGLWSPWSPHVPVIPTLSPSSPHHPHCPHVIPIAPMWSPWSVVSVVSSCCPRHPHIIPVIPTSSPHHLEGLHIIPNPPDTHPTYPQPPGGWGPQISKNAIRFELIEIF